MVLMPFKNEPFTDFSKPENRAAQEKALAEVAARCGEKIPLVINGEKIFTEATTASVDPSDHSRVVGHMSMATTEHVDQALKLAKEKFKDWASTPARHRARILHRAAAMMRRRRFEFNAWMIYEVGKSWAEADGDTAESIDFLEYYARQIIALEDQPTYPYPGEENSVRYIPLGPIAVIPPWNFPNAIMCGMTTAALVAGNTVVVKPAEQSPVIGYRVFELLLDAGLPAYACSFLTGEGEVVGEAMVVDPRTRAVAFTGSKAVGLGVYEKCGKTVPGQRWLKRAILEMGGKDATIVDADCDFDAAVAGTVAAAFGFQGQKCSAGSRAIIHQDIYEDFVDAAVKLAAKLTVGHPKDGGVNLGAVIDNEAFTKICKYIEIGKEEGRLVLGGQSSSEKGYFIHPTIIADADPDSKVAQHEIFGPVLALVKAKDFDHAIEIGNSTEYGLTGAVFSNNRARLEQAREEFHVGNLYLNRKCTGALVGVQPFGGFNMSGTDSKAGGPDYLQLFMQAQSIAERF